jgi:UDP-glucose 4-epimerase
LGSNLVRRCLREPDNHITVLDSLEPRLCSTLDGLQDVWDSITFVKGDMRDDELMAEVVQGQDIIFNCAAQSSHPLSLEDPLFDAEINCLGNLTLLEALRQHNQDAVVVFTSSSTIIGRSRGEIIDETHHERPLDIYSANKGVAEKYYRIYNVVHDIKTVMLRFANLYGPFGKGYPEFGFVNYFIHLAWQNQDITVYGTGQQTRNVMFVDDATDILYRSAFEPRLYGKVYFAAHDEHLSVTEVAKSIVSVFGRGRVVQVAWPDIRRRIEINQARISSKQLQSITGWRPRHSFKEGLARVKEHLSTAVPV